MKGELTNETVNYDTEIKGYQLKPEVQVNKKDSPGERTGLIRVFKDVVRNKHRCACQRKALRSTEKKCLLSRKLANLPKRGNF